MMIFLSYLVGENDYSIPPIPYSLFMKSLDSWGIMIRRKVEMSIKDPLSASSITISPSPFNLQISFHTIHPLVR